VYGLSLVSLYLSRWIWMTMVEDMCLGFCFIYLCCRLKQYSLVDVICGVIYRLFILSKPSSFFFLFLLEVKVWLLNRDCRWFCFSLQLHVVVMHNWPPLTTHLSFESSFESFGMAFNLVSRAHECSAGSTVQVAGKYDLQSELQQ